VLLPSPAKLRAWRRFSGVKIINNMLVQGRFCLVPFDYALYWFSPNFKGRGTMSSPSHTAGNWVSGANSGANFLPHPHLWPLAVGELDARLLNPRQSTRARICVRMVGKGRAGDMRSFTIALSFLALVISAGAALARVGTTTTELGLRQGPSPNTELLLTMPAGAKVSVGAC